MTILLVLDFKPNNYFYLKLVSFLLRNQFITSFITIFIIAIIWKET